jgi:hypothetical protein
VDKRFLIITGKILGGAVVYFFLVAVWGAFAPLPAVVERFPIEPGVAPKSRIASADSPRTHETTTPSPDRGAVERPVTDQEGDDRRTLKVQEVEQDSGAPHISPRYPMERVPVVVLPWPDTEARVVFDRLLFPEWEERRLIRIGEVPPWWRVGGTRD